MKVHSAGYRVVGEAPLIGPPTAEHRLAAGLPAEPVKRPLDQRPARPPAPPPETPTQWTKAKRLRRELQAWAKCGAKLVPTEVRKERQAICALCGYWDPAGNLGLGQCRYPGCGCTKIKAALATSKCPHNPSKWPINEPLIRP